MERELRVEYHYEPEGWWADSPDLPGFTATGATIGEVRELVKEGIGFYLGGVSIALFESASSDEAPVVTLEIETAESPTFDTRTTGSYHLVSTTATLPTSQLASSGSPAAA